MIRMLNNIISVITTFFRLILYKLICGKNFKSGYVERFSPNVTFTCHKSSKVILGKKIRIHSGTKIKVCPKAELRVGNEVKINYNCIFAVKKRIVIGSGTEFGPGVIIYDHDHDYKSGLKNNRFISEDVRIGENCWIGANSIILRGTQIGDNCVVGAGSVVKGEYSDNEVIVQPRNTVLREYTIDY